MMMCQKHVSVFSQRPDCNFFNQQELSSHQFAGLQSAYSSSLRPCNEKSVQWLFKLTAQSKHSWETRDSLVGKETEDDVLLLRLRLAWTTSQSTV